MEELAKVVYLIYYQIDRDFILKWTLILRMMIFDYISQYETHKTRTLRCQFLLDTDPDDHT